MKEGVFNNTPLLKETPKVRILLMDKAQKATLSINGYYTITGSLSNVLDHGKDLEQTTIFVKNGRFHIGNKWYDTSELQIKNIHDNGIRLNKNKYQGTIRFVRQTNNRLSVIEEIDLEHFVASVLGCEMPQAWEDDALRCQSVAIRTYVENRRKRENNAPYHLGKWDLAYKGISGETPRIRKLALETKGIVMTYQGKIFPAYFHSTCGGHTENVEHVFGKENIPPLSGVKCGYCNDSKYYTWSVDIKKSIIEQNLKKAHVNVSRIYSIQTVEPGRGGHYSMVKINSANGSEKLNANKFRLLIGPNSLYSTAFWTKNNGSNITFFGKGWGHAVGLCQYGAQGMAKKGQQWQKILEHYYPGMELRRIYY